MNSRFCVSPGNAKTGVDKHKTLPLKAFCNQSPLRVFLFQLPVHYCEKLNCLNLHLMKDLLFGFYTRSSNTIQISYTVLKIMLNIDVFCSYCISEGEMGDYYYCGCCICCLSKKKRGTPLPK